MHRRKTSKELEDLPIPNGNSLHSDDYSTNGTANVNGIRKEPLIHPRQRVHSSPTHSHVSTTHPPPSPFRNGFAPAPEHPSSPFRSNFASNPPVPPSPNSSTTSGPVASGAPSAQSTNRRHSRIHSRNLSIYFPRPGAAVQEATIAEDGAQEIEAPDTLIPSASSVPFISSAPQPKRLGEGFTFGKKPPGSSVSPIVTSPNGVAPNSATRRGHHHKHSLSHNFFSFMDPTAGSPPSATVPPSVSGTWDPITPFPQSATSTTFPKPTHPTLMIPSASTSALSSTLPTPSTQTSDSLLAGLNALPTGMKHALLFSITQFIAGASLWVSGQQNGSLGCTGLGYWIVFDASGVGLNVFHSLMRLSAGSTVQRPYGSLRIETVSLFAQCVYLLFSSVYVCKETVEHMLLAAGDSHHHHRTDEHEGILLGISFPTTLLWFSVISLIASNTIYNHHAKLVDATGNHIPSFVSLIRKLRYSSSSSSVLSPLFTNPFVLAPLLFSSFLLFTSYFISAAQQRSTDLLIAAAQTIGTFYVAYPAAVALGKVLLQTAPDRGLPGGHMESFLRFMRELERHPQVLHLPAPHIWQVAPSSQLSAPRGTKDTIGTGTGTLVVTLEIHVRKDLSDDEVLNLTRWAWERCVNALGHSAEAVTVGIVRG